MLDLLSVMPTIKTALGAFQEAVQNPYIINLWPRDGVHVTRTAMADIAPLDRWELKHLGPNRTFPYEAFTTVDGVRFFTLLEEDEAIRLGLLTVPPGEPELPEQTLEEMVIQ